METAALRLRNSFQLCHADRNGIELKCKDSVIVETEQGIDIARVMKPGKFKDDPEAPSSGKVLRLVNPEDEQSLRQIEELEEKAFAECRDRAAAKNLGMKLVAVRSLFDRTKIIFYFVSESRIDFRELVRELAGVFRTRIEMRQIGVRDQARIVGGYGPCGRELCCVNQRDEFAPVSIKMAKEQNLNLNSLKISGMCGRLLCCLGYEYETYRELNQEMPPSGTAIRCGEEVYYVISTDVLKQTLKIKDNNRFILIGRDDIVKGGGGFSIRPEVLERLRAHEEETEEDDYYEFGESGPIRKM